jgi:hypothetical protein
MSSLDVIIVLFVFIIGIYAVTRGSPTPWAPQEPCKVNDDCTPPKTCNVAARTCVDNALPGLIMTAQSAVQKLLVAVQTISQNFTNVYGAHASLLANLATAMGDFSDYTDKIHKSLANGVADLNKYTIQTLAAPSGCTSDCGYYTDVMALSPKSPDNVIWAVGSSASNVQLYLPVATQGFGPLTADLTNLVDHVTYISQTTGKQIDTATQAAMNSVNADIAQINSYMTALPPLAAAVNQTGYALYNHFIKE